MCPQIVINYFILLSATISIELIVAIFIGIRDRFGLGIVILANIFTYSIFFPLVVLIQSQSDYNASPISAIIIILEIIITLTEGIIFLFLLDSNWKRSIAYSLILNVTSYGIGVLLWIVDLS